MNLKETLTNKRDLASVLVLLAIGFLVRIISLTKLPIFADEAIYIRWSQVMRAEETLRFLPLSDGKQPLFMWLTIPFLKVFSNPLFAGRFVSVLAGTGTLLGILVLSFLLFRSKKVSFVGGLMYLISPYSFFFDRMALVDSLLSFFGIWTVVFCILTVKKLRLDLAMITGFFLGGALLTKSPGLFFSLLIPLLVFFAPLKGRSKNNISLLIRLAAYFTVIYLIGYGFYNILRLGPNFHLIASRNLDYVFPIKHIFEDPLNPFLGNFKAWLSWIYYLAPGVLVLFLPFSLYYLLRKDYLKLLILAALIIIPLGSEFEYAKVFTARYVLFTIPFLIILASSAFLSESKVIKNILWVILGVFVIFSLAQDFLFLTNPEKAFLPSEERSGYLEGWTAGTGIAETADYLRASYLKNPNQQIVVGTEGYFGTLPDGLEIYLNDLPQIKVLGVGLNLTKLPESLSRSDKSGNPTYLVINNIRLNLDPARNNLKLINSFPKAQKPNGSIEKLLFFKIQ